MLYHLSFTRCCMQAIAAEKSPDSPAEPGVDYYTVAVVRKSFCDAHDGRPTLADLKGKRACSTGEVKALGGGGDIG
jgi:hypothetical protein